MHPKGDGVFRWDVPEGWEQGLGSWGGLVSGGVVQAVRLTEPDASRRVRTVSIVMSAPLPAGPATVRLTPWRIGSSMSTWSVSVEGSDAAPVALSTVVTGRARAEDLRDHSRSWGQAVPPEMPPWQQIDPVTGIFPGMPSFLRNLELRMVSGSLLGTGPARCTGFVRFTDQGAWDPVQVLGIVDSWFPAALTVLDTPRPMATITFAAHLLEDPATVEPGEPLIFESWLSAAVEGYTSETRRLWSTDGRLLVENHQSIVVVR
jgi:hypothetical protein